MDKNKNKTKNITKPKNLDTGYHIPYEYKKVECVVCNLSYMKAVGLGKHDKSHGGDIFYGNHPLTAGK